MFAALLVWVATATLLSYTIGRLWADAAAAKAFRYALAPGVIVHELSHVIGCIITGAKVRRVVFFDADGGSVTHTKPRMPLVGQAIISLAPVGGCTIALWGVWGLFAGRLGLDGRQLPLPVFSVAGGWEFWQLMRELFAESARMLFSRQFLSLEAAAFLYLVLAFSICMAPSRTDLRHALLGLVVIAAIVTIIESTGLSSRAFGVRWSQAVTAIAWRAFSFSIMLLMLALVASVPAALSIRIFGAK